MNNVLELNLPEVKLIRPKRFGDHRGYFAETYSQAKFAQFGVDQPFVQDNESLSADAATVRGLHFQAPHHAQGKLVRCVQGQILDVAVDIRKGSPTYGQHASTILSPENGGQLWVPVGFAHGFATLQPNSLVMYKVTDIYAPNCEAGIAWNDPALGIDWQVDPATATLSDKDRVLPLFDDFESPFVYDGPIA